nr:hypothetical protein [Tanacetum cinerariifolium]
RKWKWQKDGERLAKVGLLCTRSFLPSFGEWSNLRREFAWVLRWAASLPIADKFSGRAEGLWVGVCEGNFPVGRTGAQRIATVQIRPALSIKCYRLIFGVRLYTRFRAIIDKEDDEVQGDLRCGCDVRGCVWGWE